MVFSAVIGLLLGALVPGDDNEVERADNSTQVVFIGDRCKGQEGAPPRANLGKLVILTDLAEDDPYFATLKCIEAAKKPSAIIRYAKGDIASSRNDLLKELPEFAIIVTRPESIDVNFQFALLEMAASLDEDPFVDFVFGYVTGATPEESLAFAERFLKISATRKPLPKTLIDFGPVAQGSPSFGGPAAHAIAKGWNRSHAYHGPVADLIAKKKLLEGSGFVHAGGHGMPHGIDQGLSGEDLRREQINFSPGIYFSGPCYCGVTSGWYQMGAEGFQRSVVEPQKSFALAALASGVTALFAGLDPDRGETCDQEMEHLWIHGDALGHASKGTYDGCTVALRQSKLALLRYEEGMTGDKKSMPQTMIGGGASRVLFGDPTYVPAAAVAEEAFPVKLKDGKKSLEITWSASKGPVSHWSCVDVYRCEGGWTHRIAFRKEIDAATAKAVRSFAVAELSCKSGTLTAMYPTAMIERYGGKTWLHVYLVFAPAGQKNVYYVERDFEARMVLEK